MLIKRYLDSDIISELEIFPAIYIQGPRQAGKTTLAQQWHLLHKGSAFLSFDRALEKAAASRNLLSYIESSGTPLVIAFDQDIYLVLFSAGFFCFSFKFLRLEP